MRKVITLLVFIFIFIFINVLLYQKYDNDYFDIKTYKSDIDKDADGIDDQTDILDNAKVYSQGNPKYIDEDENNLYKYNGSVDLVIYAMNKAGYNLRVIIGKDYKDFDKLNEYFEVNAKKLTTDINKIDEWQGGDIVIFKKQIGIVSDKRNIRGVPYIIHHTGPLQIKYEEDILEDSKQIKAHYRIS